MANWYADFREPCMVEGFTSATKRRVRVEVSYVWGDPTPHCWVTYDTVGTWPGTDSDEWIEYVPPVPAFFFTASDGSLFCKREDGEVVRITKNLDGM